MKVVLKTNNLRYESCLEKSFNLNVRLHLLTPEDHKNLGPMFFSEFSLLCIRCILKLFGFLAYAMVIIDSLLIFFCSDSMQPKFILYRLTELEQAVRQSLSMWKNPQAGRMSCWKPALWV